MQKKQEKNSNSIVNYAYIFVKKSIIACIKTNIYKLILIVVNKGTIWYNYFRKFTGDVMGFFDVVNVYGLLFAVILVVPHIVYARTHSYDIKAIDNRAMLYIERIGKYCSVFLMGINIGVLEKGFTAPIMETYWLISTAILTILYVVLWILFFKKETKAIAYLLTITTALIVIQSGLLQVKTLLLTAGIVYLIGELYITSQVFKD